MSLSIKGNRTGHCPDFLRKFPQEVQAAFMPIHSGWLWQRHRPLHIHFHFVTRYSNKAPAQFHKKCYIQNIIIIISQKILGGILLLTITSNKKSNFNDDPKLELVIVCHLIFIVKYFLWKCYVNTVAWVGILVEIVKCCFQDTSSQF